jgi:hypothetical protein
MSDVDRNKKGDMLSKEINKNAMIEALVASLGIVTEACEAVGISRQCHYKWMKEDEKYKELVEDISEIVLDFAEGKLHKQIKNDNTIATIFYLKTKGKKRGYIERAELEMDGKVNVAITGMEII